MSLESEVAGLTTATTNLLTAVNVSKATVDQAASNAAASASLAQDQVALAAGHADDAETKASEASGSAASALAIYGNTAAMNTAIDTAKAQASLAAGYAASAASVVQQDLSAVSAGLHRSPNAITAMFIYATQFDSDGGAWTEKCRHTSWYNETIYGKWLGAHASELSARCYNAVLGTERVSNGDFTTDLTSWTASAGASVVSGALNLVTSSSTDVTCKQTLTTVASTAYVLTFTKVSAPGNSTDLSIIVGTSDGGTQLLNLADIGALAAGTYIYAFTATTTTSFLRFTNSTNTSATSIVDSVSVKPVTTQVSVAGDYYQLTTDGKFYSLNAGSGATEVFRGNKRSFPKLAAIVAEATNVTIYDLTEAGRPMWMRFVATATATITSKYLLSGANALAAINGKIYVGGTATNATGLTTIDFAKDMARLRLTSGYTWNGNLSTRNTVGGYTTVDAAVGAIVNATANALAATVLPDAPLDPVTGLKVPTIAVATGGGISVIQNSGTVRNSSSTSSFTQITLTPQLLSAGRADTTWYSALNPGALGASFALTSETSSAAPDFNDGNTTVLRNSGRSTLARSSSAVIQLLRNNEATIGRSAAAKLSNAFNAGWLLGDIRRAYLSDSVTGSITGTVADRSYKAASATVTGTLTAAAVAPNAQLVAYSGFSAANYLREPYSADLDFGTGEWSVGAWVNTTQPAVGGNLLTYSEQFDNAAWTKINSSVVTNVEFIPLLNGNSTKINETADNTVHGLSFGKALTNAQYTFSVYAKAAERSFMSFLFSGNTYASFNLGDGTTATSGASIIPVGDGWYRCMFTATCPDTLTRSYVIYPNNGSGIVYSGSTTSGIYIFGAQLELGSVATEYKPTTNTAILPFSTLASRNFSSGPAINLQMTHEGKLQAIAYDGTTTRTVTTTAAYNTGTWTKVRATYTTDGTLGLTVNGQQVATAVGTPLLTLNNSNAVLTIGNSYALDAPFPGSIALLKFTATVPTTEQAQFMYEQEKQLFREGAACLLPESGNVLDLAYDDETDTWSALQATSESTWSGLVRTGTQAPSAGSFSQVRARSGVKLLSRTTNNPGVDVQIPAYGLRNELVKRAESAARLTQELVTFDYLGGFTATTTLGSTALNSVAGSLFPATANLVGCVISGTGIPANTTIVRVSGTTIYMSAPATANGSSIQIATTDFNLPVGYEAKAVMSAGALKREGATSDYTRRFDGFRETIRFGAAPGFSAWVQIQAVRSVA